MTVPLPRLSCASVLSEYGDLIKTSFYSSKHQKALLKFKNSFDSRFAGLFDLRLLSNLYPFFEKNS